LESSSLPSGVPNSKPSTFPSSMPSFRPSISPSSQPSSAPSLDPSTMPSNVPTMTPSTSFGFLVEVAASISAVEIEEGKLKLKPLIFPSTNLLFHHCYLIFIYFLYWLYDSGFNLFL
jgi:hypothetical protein